MTAAALGATLPVDTLDGSEDVDLAPGTQPGETITLPGKGVTHLRHQGRGDMVLHLDVKVPTRLTDEQRDLLAQLAESRGESRPTGRMGAHGHGRKSKLWDALRGR